MRNRKMIDDPFENDADSEPLYDVFERDGD